MSLFQRGGATLKGSSDKEHSTVVIVTVALELDSVSGAPSLAGIASVLEGRCLT